MRIKISTILLLITVSAWAQEKVAGIVNDDSGSPLPGATVLVKGSATYAVTDHNGSFTLQHNESYPYTIVFSSVGFKKQEIEIYEPLSSDIDISLQADNVLSEIVVVGYGTQKKEDLTGSIASIPSQVLEQPVSSFDRALQGAVAGVQVTPTSGQPGGGVSIRIRGGSSITGGNEPLYVIDGLPVVASSTSAGTTTGAEVNPLSTINPNDIESIEVLKDASATAIYGSRGANGVVIITTKSGKAGKTTIAYDATYGVQTLRKKIDLLNAEQFARLRNEALFDTNPALGPNQYLSEAEINALGKGTDWQDEAFRSASIQTHQISVSGGTDKTQYYLSGNYFKQDGIITNTDFDRFSTRVNLDVQAADRLKIGTNLTLSKSNANLAPNGIVTALLLMPPTATVYEPDGSYTLRNPFENIFSNPIAALKETVNKSETKRILGTAFAEYTIIDGLTVKILVGSDITDSREKKYLPSSIYEGSLYSGEAGAGFFNSSSWLNENTLSYSKDAGRHSFNAVVGFTQQQDTWEVLRTGARGFVSDHFEAENLENGGTALKPYSRQTTAGLRSYLGRLNYSFDDRLLLSIGARADGSSRFGANNKWGYFPSVAASWKVSNESFFPNNHPVLSNLKVRVSYGATGNNNIAPYSSLATLNTYSYIIGGTLVNGFSPSRIGNPNLGWETSYQLDGGIDVGLFRNRVSLTVDVYSKKTRDLLLNVELPYTSGYSTSLQNYGSVLNRGLEVSINTTNTEGELHWTTGLNLSVNRNEVLSIGGGVNSFIAGNYIVKVGEPLGTYYATVTDGILQAGEEETKGIFTGNATPKPGDRLYRDVNGDGRFTTAHDRAVVGSAQPDFIFGITNTLTWKGFDLNFLLQGSQGNKILNGNRQALELYNGQQNAAASALDRYTPTNTNTDLPRAKLDPAPVFSDRFIEDGSFVRLKNISFGYTLPESVVSRLRLSSLRVYVVGQNLATWTKYTGFDPEITSSNNTTEQGTDTGIYPVSKSISAGLSLKF